MVIALNVIPVALFSVHRVSAVPWHRPDCIDTAKGTAGDVQAGQGLAKPELLPR